MSGVYWGLTAMALLDRMDDMDAPRIESFVLACQHPCGGFGGNVGHDPHLLYTLSAVRPTTKRGLGLQGAGLFSQSPVGRGRCKSWRCTTSCTWWTRTRWVHTWRGCSRRTGRLRATSGAR